MKKALGQLHLAVFLAGFTAVLGKWIQLNEGVLVWYRMAITAVAMLFLFLVTKKIKKIPGKDLFQIMGVGGIMAFHWVTFYGSIKYANISVALVCFSATGFFTALLEPLILKRNFYRVDVLLGLMSVLGIAIIFNFYPEYKLGIAFGIVSAIGSALFPIFNKKFLQVHLPQTVMLYQQAGGVIFLSIFLPLYFIYFPAANYLPTAEDWLWLLILSLLCTVFTIHLQLSALKKVSPFTLNLTYSLEPVYGIIFAFIFFKENQYFTWKFYLGLAIIVVSIGLQTLRLLKKKSGN